MKLPEIDFEEVDILKRERDIEGEIGVWLRVTDTIFLHVLAQTDANSRYRTHGPRMLREINRRANAGASVEELDRLWAGYHAECVIIGWRGAVTKSGEEVPFTKLNYMAWAAKHQRMRFVIEEYTKDETNFRRSQSEGTLDELKN